MRDFTPIEKERIKVLTEKSISFSLIEPTRTGLEKSIMDATAPVRLYLYDQGLHNFQEQEQGVEHKHIVDAYLIENDSLVKTSASLYRPQTKKGDPRIWFSRLHKYANPNDILGIISFEGKLYVVNITRMDIASLLEERKKNPFEELVYTIYKSQSSVSEELLMKLKVIAKKGAIPASVYGDTAIGRVLESELGIEINSSKKPDYKGIELKSFREKRGNRKTLFAQVPNWELSKFKSSAEILDNFGYYRGNDFKLYCTISTKSRNSQGLIFKMDDTLEWLVENSDRKIINDFAVWTLKKLHERLLEKHNETFWIAAKSEIFNGFEYFSFTQAEHTKKPILSQFDIMLDQGVITMDHLIKRNDKGNVVEKGPLFKIKSNSLDMLFPPSQLYDLRN